MADGVAIKRAQCPLKLQKFVLILTTMQTQETNMVKIAAITPQMIPLGKSVVFTIGKDSEHLICVVHAVEDGQEMSKFHLLSHTAKTLIREVSLMEPMRRSLTHTATLVTGTTQRSTILFVGNSILTNSKQKKCVASVVVVILKKVFP